MVLDKDVLEKLRDETLSGSTENFCQVLELFIQGANASMDKIPEWVKEKNFRKLEFEFHRLKSNALSVGALEVASLCDDLKKQLAAKEKTNELVFQKTHSQLKSAFDSYLQELKAYYPLAQAS